MSETPEGHTHVTTLQSIIITKPTGARTIYPANAHCVVPSDLAAEWLAEGKAGPYPLPPPQSVVSPEAAADSGTSERTEV